MTPQGGGSINKFYIGTESTPKFAATGSPGINIYGLYSSSLSDTHVNIFYDDDTGGQSTIATCLGNNTTYYARFPLVTGTVALDATVPNFQATTSVVGNAVTNVNGRVFQNYTATLVTAGGYTFYQILKNGSNPTESEAKEYMRYMTGSTFLPTYNYDFPKQTTFIFADSSMWKPQYSENDGLRLYRLSTGYVNLDGAQTISGAKTFSTSPILNNGVYLKGKNSSSTQYGLIGISSANNVVINPDSVSDTIIYGNRFRPGSGATPDLGSSSNKWKDIYLSGSLSDGTNSISVANIVAKQNALPTTTTAGQVLKSTSTSGTVEWGSVTDNDHYPTTFTWTDGTTAGPTGSLTGNSGFSAVSFGAIPSATASVSGIVTTDEQTFAGKKIFKNGIQIGNSVPNTATLQANNASLRFSGNVSSFTPSQTNSMSLGASITGTLYTWKNLFLSGFLSKDNSSYGLELPSSSGWTANKTIATTDQIPTVSYPVTDVQIGGTSILSGTVANIVTNSTYNASTNKIATMSDLPQIVDLRS